MFNVWETRKMTCIGCEPEKTRDVMLDLFDGIDHPLCFKHEKLLWQKIEKELEK